MSRGGVGVVKVQVTPTPVLANFYSTLIFAPDAFKRDMGRSAT